MRLLVPLTVAALLAAAGPARAQSSDLENRLKKLEMKVDGMEKGKEGEAPKTGESTGGKSMIEVYFDDGLRFRACNNDFEGRIGAYVIQHTLWFPRHLEKDHISGFTMKETGVDVWGRLFQAWEVYIRAVYAPGGASLYYGWAEFNKWDVLCIRAGYFKEPYSMETQEDVKWQDMPENSLINPQTPGRDLGVMVHGNIGKGIFRYAVGLFNGNGSVGGAPNTDENSDKDFAMRLVLQPGAQMESDLIKHLYIGVAMTRGMEDKGTNETPFSFESPATQTAYHAPSTPGTPFVDNDHTTRFQGELAYLIGLGDTAQIDIKGEWSYLKAKLEFGDAHETFRSDGFYTSLGFWLFGSRSLGKRPVVNKPLFNGGVGAFQLVVRYSQMRLDNTFEELAGFGGNRHPKEYAAALNWYPNQYVRISLMYAQEVYSHRDPVALASGTLVKNDNVWIIRAQVDF